MNNEAFLTPLYVQKARFSCQSTSFIMLLANCVHWNLWRFSLSQLSNQKVLLCLQPLGFVDCFVHSNVGPECLQTGATHNIQPRFHAQMRGCLSFFFGGTAASTTGQHLVLFFTLHVNVYCTLLDRINYLAVTVVYLSYQCYLQAGVPFKNSFFDRRKQLPVLKKGWSYEEPTRQLDTLKT